LNFEASKTTSTNQAASRLIAEFFLPMHDTIRTEAINAQPNGAKRKKQKESNRKKIQEK